MTNYSEDGYPFERNTLASDHWISIIDLHGRRAESVPRAPAASARISDQRAWPKDLMLYTDDSQTQYWIATTSGVERAVRVVIRMTRRVTYLPSIRPIPYFL